MTHEEAQNSPQTAERVSRALPDATDAGEALVQQIAEALRGWWHQPPGADTFWVEAARAVLPLVEAQVAPLRDEVSRARAAKVESETEAADAVAAQVIAESALRQVREALARVKRIYEMQCPIGSRDDYMDEGAYFAHQWWQTVLGGELRRADGLLARIGAADKQHEGAGEVTIEQAMWPVVDAYVHAHGNLCPCGLPEAHLLGGKFVSRDQGSHARLAAWGGAYPDDKDTPTAGSNGDTAPEAGQ